MGKKDKNKEMAVDYLEQWGNKFWLTTEQRMHELTQRIEDSLAGSIKGELAGIDLSINGAKTLTEEQMVQGDNPEPEIILLVNWRNQELLNALDALSPNHRAVIELVFGHEMAYAEIAQIVDCPVGTVKSRVSYALRHLNRLLSNADVS